MWTVTASPVGDLRLVADGDSLTGVDFLGEMPIEGVESRSVARFAARAGASPLGERVDDHPLLLDAVRPLASYVDGDLRDLDLPVAPRGSEFQRRVWAELQRIGYGETASYGQLAARLGLTGHGARAVGTANGRNPVPVVIPCHRVVGSTGSLTGYGGGITRKRFLLDLEQPALV